MVCAGCHKPEPGTLPASEAERIPRLGGQQPDYLRAALDAYRSRQRDHFYMRGIAAGLKGAELEEAIRFFSAAAAGTPSAPRAASMPAVAARCVQCHGAEGQRPVTPGWVCGDESAGPSG